MESLKTDWYANRDEKTDFILHRDDSLPWDTLTSSFISHLTDKKALIKASYKRGRDIIGTFKFSGKVSLRVTEEETSYTDSSTFIVASSKVFDYGGYSFNQRMDVFMGLVVHECCHVRCTDQYTYGKGIESSSYKELQKFFQNVLEDERIERDTVLTYPGYATFLSATKRFYFRDIDKKVDDKWVEVSTLREDKTEEKELPDYAKCLNLFLRIIRFPVFTEEDDRVLAAHEGLFSAFKVAFDESPKKDTLDIVSLATTFTKIFVAYFSEKGLEIPKDSTMKDLMDLLIDADEMGELPEGLKSILKVLAKALGFGEGEMSEDFDEANYFREEVEGTVVTQETIKTHFIAAKDTNASTYSMLVQECQNSAATMKRIFSFAGRSFDYVVRNSKTGRLDGNKLVDAYLGSDSVYKKLGRVRSTDIATVLLLDLSGSMRGTKIKQAAKVTVLLDQAFGKHSDVELFIYGHTADIRYSGATEIIVYREHGQPYLKAALGAIEAKYENRDGTAIAAVAERVRSKTKQPGIMFVIADGEPCADSYHGNSAIKHTKECVKKAEKLGFVVIHIVVGDAKVRSNEMFSHWIKFTNVQTFPRELGLYVQNVLKTHHKINYEDE